MRQFVVHKGIFRNIASCCASDLKLSNGFLCTSVFWCPVKSYSTKTGSHQLSKGKTISFAGYAMLTIPVITFCLGTWQVKRRKWKLNLIESLNQKLYEPAVDLPMDLEDLRDLDYRKVILRGTFDHEHEQYITPRTFITTEKDSSRGLISSNKNTGSHVITPFKLTDRNQTVLINRGWVPRKQTMPYTRPEGQVAGEVEIIGIYRKSDKRPPFMPKNDPCSIFWHWRDVNAIAEKLDVEPYFFDAVSASSVPGGPIGGQTQVQLRNEHFSYIVTWYSLSLATSYLWYKRYIRGLPLM